MKTRVCVVGLLQNSEGKYLLTKKPDHLGVYPGLWGLPGGGVDNNELIDNAFIREMNEETGLKVESMERWFFDDDEVVKFFKDEVVEEQYLIFLFYKAKVSGDVELNSEHDLYAWVRLEDVNTYDLSEKTKMVLERISNE
jgi:8-oxo-dGTP pyrophosphatase MutT (NUDIX family)